MNAKHLIPALTLALVAGVAAAAFSRDAAKRESAADCATRAAQVSVPRIVIAASPVVAPDSVPRIVVIGHRAGAAQALAAARP